MPTNESHEKTYPTGIISGMAQKVNPTIANKIEEFVKEGMTDPSEVQRALRSFVKSCMFENAPHPLDCAYYPTSDDIRNHIYQAKTALQLPKFDQQNLKLLIKDWQTTQPLSSHYFHPYKCHTDEQQCHGVNSNSLQANEFLWVHQEQWQKDLLSCYGNQTSLMDMDATYRTTKYDLPLFFVCIKTNCNYMVVAEFIIGSESMEAIVEPLKILQTWNPSWNPRYFITDYSDAEIAAKPDRGWNALPPSYLQSAYLSCDTDTITCFYKEFGEEASDVTSQHAEQIDMTQHAEQIDMICEPSGISESVSEKEAFSELQSPDVFQQLESNGECESTTQR